jgi:regulatory protein spx
MIIIYTSPSCSSCRKVKKWFEEQNIPFEERNIFSATLNEKELKEMLSKSENGTEDIISTRSKIIKEENIDIESMSIRDLIEFIRANPSILKRPIIVDDRRIQVGYNEEEIRTFIPLARRYASLMCSPENCERYGCCDHIQALDLDNKSSSTN